MTDQNFGGAAIAENDNWRNRYEESKVDIEPEDAEALRMKQLLEELALFPVEMEMDFYKTAVKFINGEEPYMPNILDYEEVVT